LTAHFFPRYDWSTFRLPVSWHVSDRSGEMALFAKQWANEKPF
jgi:hypothetical protein